MTNSIAATMGIQERTTVPQLETGTVILSEAYESSRERFMEHSKKQNGTLLYMRADRGPFLERIDLWATMVIYGAMLREQQASKKEVQEEEEEEIQEEPIMPSGLRELAPTE